MSREMKNSGIPWIGEIPASWQVCFIKQVMRNKSMKGFPDEQVLSLYREHGVVPKDSRDDNHNVTSEDTSGYKLVDIGDFVINKMKAWQGSMAVSDYRGIISPAYYICRITNEDVNKRYIHYLLRNESYKDEYMRLSTGLRIGQWDLNIEDFLRIKMILPSLVEQKSIAEFLDRKCGEIDEMISLQEKIIEELKAYKQSVITETVCRGLNPDVPMKDSGIEWIGKIPEGWNTCKLKYQYTLLNGRAYSDSELLENGKYKVLRVGNLFTSDKWYYSNLELDSNKYCEQGDLLYGWSASLGALIWKEEKVIYHYHIWKVLLGGNSLNYSYYLFNAITESKRKDMHGTAMQHITKGVMDNSYIPVIPLKEQQDIAVFLDAKCSEIDSLIALKQSKIEALKEYKKSTIYEYVTGKKEVIE